MMHYLQKQAVQAHLDSPDDNTEAAATGATLEYDLSC